MNPRQRIVVGGIGFTPRQLEVLLLLHSGADREEIARQLGMTVKGIEYNITANKLLVGIPRLLELLRWVDEHLADVKAALT